MKLEFSRQISEQSSMKFHQNPSSGSGVVPCGRTDRWTDGYDEAFHNFANAPKKAAFLKPKQSKRYYLHRKNIVKRFLIRAARK